MTTNVGIRGGNPYCLSRADAEALVFRWKLDEWGWLRARILVEAVQHGDFHGDYLEHVEMSNRNMIGILVGRLRDDKLLAETSHHRASRAPASHRRRSYVYVLTDRGRDFAEKHYEALAAIGGRSVPSPQTRLEL